MSNDDDEVLKAWAKWQKDVSRHTLPKPPKLYKIIDQEFAKPIGITEGGKCRQGTTFEGIMLILDQEVGKGRKRALRIRRKYEAYAQARPQVIVQPNLDRETATKIYDYLSRTGHWPGQEPDAKSSKPDPEYESLTLEERQALYEAMNKKDRCK